MRLLWFPRATREGLTAAIVRICADGSVVLGFSVCGCYGCYGRTHTSQYSSERAQSFARSMGQGKRRLDSFTFHQR